MTVIQPGSLNGTDKKLGAVGVFTGVGHADPSSAMMLYLQRNVGVRLRIRPRGQGYVLATSTRTYLKVLIGEFFSINGFSAGPISSREITTLDHKIFDDAVEFASSITTELSTGSRGLLTVALREREKEREVRRE